jgi:hypothetical protein
MMSRRAIEAHKEDVSRERLYQLLNAVALVIARRQMKRYWALR